jgi:hypothetical protein
VFYFVSFFFFLKDGRLSNTWGIIPSNFGEIEARFRVAKLQFQQQQNQQN